jgi:hypothetical protein
MKNQKFTWPDSPRYPSKTIYIIVHCFMTYVKTQVEILVKNDGYRSDVHRGLGSILFKIHNGTFPSTC